MASPLKSLALNTQITATSATARQLIYTSNDGKTTPSVISVYNGHASTAYDAYLYYKTDTTTSGTLKPVEKITVSAGQTGSFTKTMSHVLEQGYSIQVHDTSGADMYISASGYVRP